MTDEEKQGRLESGIADMLKANGYIFIDEMFGIQWVSDETKIAELWNVNGDAGVYISNMAHDMLAVFGDLALILVTPVVMIQNFSYNFYSQEHGSNVVAEFDLMQTMNGGGHS